MRKPSWPWLAAGALLLAGWLYFTPPGLLGKADAIAYAVCARNPAHSPFFGSRQMPLCYRDTGMHLGALLTWLFLAWRAPRHGLFPRGAARWGLGLLAACFVIDGGNSFLHDLSGHTVLYPPNNVFRLFTGAGMGIVIGALLYAAFHQTVWRQWTAQPALTTTRLVAAFALVGAASALVLSGNPLLLYVVALVTTGDVVFLLTLIYTLFGIGLRRRENTARRWGDLTGTLFAGWVVAMAQIALLDALRFAMTHTWGAFPLPR